MPDPEGGWVVILGAGSPIGDAFAAACAERGLGTILAGRDVTDLERRAADLRLRHASDVRVIRFDALEFDSHAPFMSQCAEVAAARLEGVLWCVGIMPEEDEMRSDPVLLQRMIDTNYTAAVSILERAGESLAAHHGAHGWIAGISSVAGDRGRASNALYGSSKAGLSTYLSGLRVRLASKSVRVIDIRPGFVDTALTHGRPGVFLAASPAHVAHDIWRGIERDRAVVYTPWFWRFVMQIIRAVPDFLFKRLPL